MTYGSDMDARTKQTRQSIDNLRGEVAFREKLSRQHVTGEVLLPDYYRKEEHDDLLRRRVEDTRRDMQALSGAGVAMAPFLELGAERGQRSLVLVNDFAAQGVAADLSFHQLSTSGHFARLFGYETLPMRVCCNANQLPYRNGSFPFVFCYAFLHHFPTLKRVVAELHRVLSDGYFFFAEEPYRRIAKVVLYQQRSKVYSARALRKNRYVRLVESFFSAEACDETEHGIIENHDIGLAEWLDALAIFDEHNLTLRSMYNLSSQLHRRMRWRNLPNALLGGMIEGLCRKRLAAGKPTPSSLADCLACPDCIVPLHGGSFDRPALIRLDDRFRCSLCSYDYPVHDGIALLLPRQDLEALYPEMLSYVPTNTVAL